MRFYGVYITKRVIEMKVLGFFKDFFKDISSMLAQGPFVIRIITKTQSTNPLIAQGILQSL